MSEKEIIKMLLDIIDDLRAELDRAYEANEKLCDEFIGMYENNNEE